MDKTINNVNCNNIIKKYLFLKSYCIHKENKKECIEEIFKNINKDIYNKCIKYLNKNI